MRYGKQIELIDWSERYPQENSFELTVRESTYCICGAKKEIGQKDCGSTEDAHVAKLQAILHRNGSTKELVDQLLQNAADSIK